MLPTYDQVETWIGGDFRFKGQSLGQVFSYFLPIIFVIAGLVLLVFLILGGFRLLTSAGNPKSIASGQKMLSMAVVGFLIVISAFWLYQIIATVLDLPGDNLGELPGSGTLTCEQSCRNAWGYSDGGSCQALDVCEAGCSESKGAHTDCGADLVCCCNLRGYEVGDLCPVREECCPSGTSCKMDGAPYQPRCLY